MGDSAAANMTAHLLRNSPAAALHSFDSPGTMLPSLSGMGFMDGGIAMGSNLSRLSGLNSAIARGNDEEMRRKLDAIVGIIRDSCPVRLSPEGLEIVGQRLGMDVVLDPPKQARKDGTRDCYLAGQTIVIEVLATPGIWTTS
jgi:hypothetical protein